MVIIKLSPQIFFFTFDFFFFNFEWAWNFFESVSNFKYSILMVILLANVCHDFFLRKKKTMKKKNQYKYLPYCLKQAWNKILFIQGPSFLLNYVFHNVVCDLFVGCHLLPHLFVFLVPHGTVCCLVFCQRFVSIIIFFHCVCASCVTLQLIFNWLAIITLTLIFYLHKTIRELNRNYYVKTLEKKQNILLYSYCLNYHYVKSL